MFQLKSIRLSDTKSDGAYCGKWETRSQMLPQPATADVSHFTTASHRRCPWLTLAKMKAVGKSDVRALAAVWPTSLQVGVTPVYHGGAPFGWVIAWSSAFTGCSFMRNSLSPLSLYDTDFGHMWIYASKKTEVISVVRIYEKNGKFFLSGYLLNTWIVK